MAAGGTVYQPKTQISEEHGFMAVFIDSEGNRVALHSDK
jgi:predicted enzyme related to lactoylglutathione lyase